MAKCSECGLLTVRDNVTHEPREATERGRRNGRQNNSQGVVSIVQVFCRAGEPCFPVQSLAKPDVTAMMLTQDVPCDSFVRWIPTKSPREHEEMTTLDQVMRMRTEMLTLHRDMLAIQEAALSWRQSQSDLNQSQAEKNLKWEQQILALQQIHHNENLAVGKSQAGGTNWQAIGAIVGAVTGILALIVAILALAKA